MQRSLVGHYLGVDAARMAAAITGAGGLAGGIEALDGPSGDRRRLLPLRPSGPGLLGRPVAALHPGDPSGPEDAWRPWRRRRRMSAAQPRP